ncbi:MAG: aryl-sulfate sulfotransferase, partial [Nannocystaceae bacterium]
RTYGAALALSALLGCTSNPDGDESDGTTGGEDTSGGVDTTDSGTEDSDTSDGSDTSTGGTESGDRISILDLTVIQPEDCGLSVILEVETSLDSMVEVTTTTKDGLELAAAPSLDGTSHRIILAGLHALNDYELTIKATSNADGSSISESELISTGALPTEIQTPSLPATNNGLDPATFGSVVHAPVARSDSDPDSAADTTVALARDVNGEVTWWYRDLSVSENFVARDVDILDDGRIMVRIPSQVWMLNAACEVLATYSSPVAAWTIHHDALVLPNGNILALAREIQEVDVPALGGLVNLQGDTLIEIDPEGEAVWTWSAFDHLDTQRFPGALSSNEKGPPSNSYYDWTHGNGIWYDDSDDSILLSLRHQNWVIKVDHTSGDVIWTLGEDGDFTLAGTGAEWFYSQHMPSITADGSILLYDNGNERPDDPAVYSRAVRMSLDLNTMTATQEWQYQVPAYTPFLGGAIELESGNVLVTAGGQRTEGVPAYIIEVDPSANNDVAWQLEYPTSVIYRARRRSSIAGETLSP